VKKSREFKLSGPAMLDLGVNRHASYRGLKALEAAGLVSVQRAPGSKPVVKILELAEAFSPESDL
jgi:hypothetical protein